MHTYVPNVAAMYIGVVMAEKDMRIVASRQPPQGYSFQAIP